MEKQKHIYLGTNTKMYKTIQDTTSFLSSLSALTADIDRKYMTLFVIPSFTTLDAARKTVPADVIRLGAQNMGWEDQGQFTGEISPLMLKEVGTQIIEIGHSERRHVLMETDEMENKKVLCALRHGFTPLLCIGETGKQKELGISAETLRIQLKVGLKDVTPQQAATQLWIAYEPVWAIGVGGTPASKEYAMEMHAVIRDTVKEMFGEEAGSAIPLLYGGSVNRENAVELAVVPNIDGLFIGRSAWDAENFNLLIRDVLKVWGYPS